MVTPKATRRLPATAHPPSRASEVGRGLLALAATAAIVVGVPVVLIAAFGAPWPRHVPGTSWLTAPITSSTLLDVLAVVVWLAWLHFVVCLVVELLAERRARGLALRVPGGGLGTQSLARRLVAAIVLLAGTTSVAVSSASAATTPADDRQVTHTRTIVAPDLVLAHEDALELPALDELSRATRADVRAQDRGEVTYYDVKPPHGRNYDTLWDIAERYLGDGLRYKEIHELNRGVTQPDGRVLGRPDLIYPGWVMRMPSDASGPGLKVVDHAVEPTPDPTSRTTGPTDPAPTGLDHDASTAPAQTASPAVGGGSWSPVFGVGGGLALAGAALTLRRRRAGLGTAGWWAARTPGPPGPDGPDGPDRSPPSPGAALRDEADLATASWLDRAVRSLDDGHGPVPAPTRCTVADSDLAVAFGAAPGRPAPAGWHETADGRVWTIERSVDPSNARGDEERTALSPLPGLVTVGRNDDGSLLMLDLESIPGLVSLGGDPTSARALALSIAVDTATHPWADDRTVTMVGFADDISGIGDGTIRVVDDVERAVESMTNVARHQRAACRRADTVSARQARALDPTNGAWGYQLVVCSGVPSPAAVAALSDLAADQQLSLGVVVVGDCVEAAARLVLTAGGRLSAGVLGVDVDAQQLAVEAGRALIDLLPGPATGSSVSLDEVAAGLAAEVGMPPSTAGPTVRIDVLGPVQIVADGAVDEQRRNLLTEMAVFIALRPSGAHANVVGAAVWPRGVDDSTRDAALQQLRSWLVLDGEPVLHEQAGIWALDRTRLAFDWDLFREALDDAARTTGARAPRLQRALSLVRGVAFSGVPDRRYSWLGADSIEDDIALAVVLTATVAAEAAAARDDAIAAREALRRGLAAAPASEELWTAALRLAERFGGREDATVVADQMYAAIDDAGSGLGPSAATEALVDEVLPGYRVHAA